MITASLVLYNSNKADLVRVLDCVERSIIDIFYVIDNSSSDTLQLLVGNFKKCKYIFGQGNVGYGEGNNIAIRLSIDTCSKYHVILNPDIIFEPEVIKNLAAYMDEHIDTGLIKPEQTNPSREFNTAAKLLPTPFLTFGRRFFPHKWVDKLNEKYEMHVVDLSVTRNVPNFSGSFLFIRVSTLKQVGLFDKRYFMYFEDFDLVRRIHKVSKTIFYPHVHIIHAHGAEHRRSKKLLIMGLKSGIKYYNKWGWFFDSDRKKWNREALSDVSICE